MERIPKNKIKTVGYDDVSQEIKELVDLGVFTKDDITTKVVIDKPLSDKKE